MITNKAFLIFFLMLGSCGYDMQNEPLKPGSLLKTSSTLKLSDGQVKISGTYRDLKGTMTVTESMHQEVDVVSLQEAARINISILNHTTELELNIEGNSMQEKKLGELHSKRCSFEFKNDSWQPVDLNELTPHQQRLFQNLARSSGDDYFPRNRINIGDSWTVDGPKLRKLLGPDIDAVSGSMKCQFDKTSNLNGQSCAVILFTIDISTKSLTTDGDEITSVMNMSGSIYRSLESKIDLKFEAAGLMSTTGKNKIPGWGTVDMSLNGRCTFLVEQTMR